MPDQQAAQQQGQQPSSQTAGLDQMAGLTCEKFAGVNTATTRAGVPDEQAYWIDGFMYLAARNLRTLYGIGAALYTASGNTIVCFYFYNIGATPYVIMFLSDGSAIQVNTSTGAVTTIFAAATIASPSIVNVGVSQYGQQYLLIVANQQNGYWIWDGTVLYGAGTLAPGVTLTNVGSGYFAAPTITASGGHGSGAAFIATIANGSVNKVTIVNPGAGYLATDTVTLNFSGGNTAGSGAVLTANMAHQAGGTGAVIRANWELVVNPDYYELTSMTVTNPGSGYDAPPTTIAVFGGAPAGTQWYNNAAPSISLGVIGGQITFANIVANPANPNSLFINPGGGFPVVNITDAGFYYVSTVTVNNGGSNYGPNAAITASGGSSPLAQATLQPVLSSGVISSVTVTYTGQYGGATPPTLTITDSASTATGTVSLAPFGIQGTAVESYQGHVWVFNGNVFNFTAPGSVTNFATSAGGGSGQSSVSYLKVGYVQVVSTNGFLFIIGDSSMDYISGVQTTGTPPTTTFTQNNCDPEIGTPYPAAVTTLGQDILVANPTGIFVSSGGAFVKQSEPMDGVYNTVPATQFNLNPFNGFQLSAAKATIFGKRVWMVLVPIVDPVSGSQVNKILMFNGKLWWASQQDVALTFIQGQEINSVYTAWGTDGTHLYPLFNQPSTAFTKTLQTKLWDEPGGYESNKADNRFWSVWDCFSTSSTALTVDIDAVGIDGSGNQYSNTNSYAIPGPTALGYFLTLPQAIGQQGVFTGMTITTQAADMALVSIKLGAGAVQYRG
jgi:hypothetical protein